MSERGRDPINASNIGLYIGFEECPRYLKQSMGGGDGNEDELGVFLSEAGEQFEEEILDRLRDDAAMFIDADERGEWDLPNDYSEALTVIQQNFEDMRTTWMKRDFCWFISHLSGVRLMRGRSRVRLTSLLFGVMTAHYVLTSWRSSRRQKPNPIIRFRQPSILNFFVPIFKLVDTIPRLTLGLCTGRLTP